MLRLQSGGTQALLQHTLAWRRTQIVHVPPSRGGVAPPADSDAAWTTTLSDIGRVAPLLHLSLIRKYLSETGGGILGAMRQTRALRSAFQRISTLSHLLNFKYHRVEGELVCWICCDIPASMRRDLYRVFVRFRVEDAADDVGLPVVVEILLGLCTCVARETQRCVHVAGVLLIVHCLLRPDHVGPVSPTALLCRWNKPSDGASYDHLAPIEYMPFLQRILGRIPCRVVAANRSDGGRSRFRPTQVELRQRDDPALVPRRARLLETLRAADDHASAYELQWCPGAAAAPAAAVALAAPADADAAAGVAPPAAAAPAEAAGAAAGAAAAAIADADEADLDPNGPAAAGARPAGAPRMPRRSPRTPATPRTPGGGVGAAAGRAASSVRPGGMCNDHQHYSAAQAKGGW